jgi:hypothetical protein
MNPSFSTARQRTLAAVADRIIPADGFPSASQSGAIEFVRRLLDRDLPHRWAELINGLDGIDRAAQAAHGVAFVDLDAERQDSVLMQIETDGDADARRFFAWVVELVNESYYADPANGGNIGAVSWTMVGYEPHVPGYDGGKPAGNP